jgi:hypothetical protein
MKEEKMSATCESKPSISKAVVWRVIDDGTCVLTTIDADKALRKLMEILEKYDVTCAWVDEEVLE